jgi:hypothetical protein
VYTVFSRVSSTEASISLSRVCIFSLNSKSQLLIPGVTLFVSITPCAFQKGLFFALQSGHAREQIGPRNKHAPAIGLSPIFNFLNIIILGKFRTSTKTMKITNTSSFCVYVRQSRVVIFDRFAGVNEDRLPFSGLCLIDAIITF